MRAAHVTFYVIILTGVFGAGSSENLLTEINNLNYNCPKKNSSIDFSGSVIKLLGENFISSPIITCLDLEGNQIEIVKKDAFLGLPNLRYLNMAGNEIVDLTSFGGHEKLETLILANQSSRYLKHVIFTETYPSLGELNLRNNNIRSINWSMKTMNQLFPRLFKLQLSDNIISHLDFGDLVSPSIDMAYIFFCNNEMTYADLRGFKNILLIMANDNEFYALEKHNCYQSSLCINDMAKLSILSLSNNMLSHIDHDFFNHMTDLVMLNLSSNQLDNHVNERFDDLINLKSIDLSNNKLTNISIFNKPMKLFFLYANLNKIESINSEDLENVANLTRLYLNNNNLKDIDKNAFRSLNKLEQLHLANNLLTNLPAEWSNNLTELWYLDLTNNRFQYLESVSLRDSLSLIRIDLVDNKINGLTSKTLRNIPENVTIYLERGQEEIGHETTMYNYC